MKGPLHAPDGGAASGRSREDGAVTERVVVIGGDAAGMTAASQALRAAKRYGRRLEVVALERGGWTSYSACGIPYWVAGDVDTVDDLIARTPEEHRSRGIDVRLHTEATGIDLAGGSVEVHDHQAGTTTTLGYDHLVVATGAEPVRPPVPGIDGTGVHGLQTLTDGARLIEDLERSGDPPKRAVVIGAGYIGVEVAEALVRRGLAVTVVDQAPEPMTTLDPDMGAAVHEAMDGMGIDVVTGTAVDGVESAGGRVCGVVAGGTTYEADVVVLGLGVRPQTALAGAAGLPLGETGGMRVDVRMAVPGHPDVWSAGDCVESFDRVSQTWTHVPLGTHANKQGRVLGTNLGGGYATFPGIVRTAVSKVCDLEIARTGLREIDAQRAGLRHVTAVIDATTRAGYYPGAQPIKVKVLAEEGTGRLLGGQIVGRQDAAKRIDTLAVALWNGMSVRDLAMVDLSYAPPFSPVWDPVLTAAAKASELLRG